MLQQRWPLLLILLVYLGIATLYARLTPAWQAPDEPAHYNYSAQLADGRWPVMEVDDYNQAYQSEVIGAGFDPAYSIEPFTYEDYQPPLYYLLQTPVFQLTEGDLLVMRQVGVALGGLTLILAFLAFEKIAEIFQSAYTDKEIAPGFLRCLVWAATIFFAFLPQHIALQASVNNDSLSEFLVAAILVWLLADVQRLRAGRPANTWWQRPAFLGLLLGLAFLTKVTAYLMAPVIGLYLLWLRWGRWSDLTRECAAVFGPAFFLGGLWWLRNLAVYGWPDFLGIIAHDAAVIGQPTTAEWVDRFGAWETLRRFLQTTFRSFWGQFGWMGVVMDRQVYRAAGIFTLVLSSGATVLLIRGRRAWHPLRPLVVIFFTLAGLNWLLLVTYNLTFVQHQGRYLFSSLIPLSLVVPAGLAGWLSVLPIPSQKWPAAGALLTAGLALAMVALDLLALFWFILPQLS